MNKETFGQRITRLRKEKGLTQNDIAERVNVTSQAVSKWENDQATPDIDILVKLSEIYDISLDELLGKEKHSTVLTNKPNKKDFDSMILKITILDVKDGDKVNINLPLALVRVFTNQEGDKVNILNGNKALENIDFKQIIELVENGVVGELVNIESGDGDTIRIYVE